MYRHFYEYGNSCFGSQIHTHYSSSLADLFGKQISIGGFERNIGRYQAFSGVGIIFPFANEGLHIMNQLDIPRFSFVCGGLSIARSYHCRRAVVKLMGRMVRNWYGYMN